MKRRLRTPTCGAARPTPSPTYIVSYMPCDEARRGRRRSRRRRAARCFSTGSPKSRSGYMPPRYRGLPSDGARTPSDPARIDVDPQPPERAARRRRRRRRARRRARRPTARAHAARRVPSLDRTRGPSTPAAASASHAAATARRVAAHLGQPAERREAERLRRRASSAATTSVGSPRARRRDAPRARAAGSDEQQRPAVASAPSRRARPHEQPERLLGGPAPGREQLLVELEERDQADRRPAARRCSTASVPTSTRHVGHGVGGGVDRRHLALRGSSAARSSRTR